MQGEDDGLIVRELGLSKGVGELATGAVLHNYHVKVYTGDVKYAGTDANVHIVLCGEVADSGMVPLLTSAHHRNKFERAQVPFALAFIYLSAC